MKPSQFDLILHSFLTNEVIFLSFFVGTVVSDVGGFAKAYCDNSSDSFNPFHPEGLFSALFKFNDDNLVVY